MSVQFYTTSSKKHDVIVVPVLRDGTLPSAAAKKDENYDSLIQKSLERLDGFKAEQFGSIAVVDAFVSDDKNVVRQAVLFVAVEKKDQGLSQADCEALGAKICGALKKEQRSIALWGEDFYKLIVKSKDHSFDPCAAFAHGMVLRSYRFDHYKTKTKVDEPANSFKELSLICGKHAKDAGAAYKIYQAIEKGVFEARDLVSEPANMLNPVTYAKRVKALFKGTPVTVRVLDDKKMKKMGMEGIVSVGKGSTHTPSRMVLLEYNGLGKTSKKPKLAMVGKGVTFDTGGISIKPGAGMEDMKFDMAGSAAVVGAVHAIQARGAKVHVVGAIGLAENMLSAAAYRPSDILKTYSGQTVEVMNTDAEGRLVLADTLTYVQKEYKPETIIDLATLTGAMMVGLGCEYAGVFATSDALYQDLEAAGADTEELVWRMPLHKEYDKQINSPIADMRNLGATRYGGACTAAAFLHRFIEGDVEWAHLDIAGTAWWKSDRLFVPKGATGFGVRLLDRFVKNRYE